MISLRKSDIPEYLKRGVLYRSLLENNDDPHEEVTFPAKVLHLSESVDCTEDLDNLLNSLRFWAVDDPVSVPVLNFVLLARPSPANIPVLRKYETDFDFASWLIRVATAEYEDKVTIAIQSGIFKLYLCITVSIHLRPRNACDLAAEAGCVEILANLKEQGCLLSANTGAIAASRGHIGILEYWCEKGNIIGSREVRSAVAGGHLK